MLAVLAEINCLETLQQKGVYPDEFYTDIEVFKNRTIFMKDTTVLVIFAGSCQFNKRYTLEFLKTLMHRAEAEQDSGIKKVYIVSDMTLAGIRSYYKYQGNLDLVDIMHGWKCAKQGVNIWPKLATGERKTTSYLSAYDAGNVDAVIAKCQEEAKDVDEYSKVIKVPNIQEFLEARARRQKEIAEAKAAAAKEAELAAAQA